MENKIKYYIEIPCLQEYRKYRKRTWLSLPFLFFIAINWSKYDFSFSGGSNGGIYPKYTDTLEGRKLFEISIGILWWCISLNIYKNDAQS